MGTNVVAANDIEIGTNVTPCNQKEADNLLNMVTTDLIRLVMGRQMDHIPPNEAALKEHCNSFHSETNGFFPNLLIH